MGSYYTPDVIIRYLVDGTLTPILRGKAGRMARGQRHLHSGAILQLKVLDPAMGSGHFLIAAADLLARAYGSALVREGRADHGNRISKEAMQAYRRIVSRRCIYGVDRDPVAAELARMTFWFFTKASASVSGVLRKHLQCGDALSGECFALDESDGRTRHRRAESPEIPGGLECRDHPGFDAVVGNPPYASFAGRHRVPSGGRQEVRRHRAGLRGWPSLHGLFVQRAIGLAKDSGFVSLVVPEQVGYLRGYAPVRAGLLRMCNLKEVRYWGEEVFKRITSPALTFIAQKHPSSYRKTDLITRAGEGFQLNPEGEEEWYTSPFRASLDMMAARHLTIEGFSDPGVHTGNVSAKLIIDGPATGAVPIIEGRQVQPFRCDPPRRWLRLRYSPADGEYFRICDPATYGETDVLLRQTASRPVAARHLYHCHFRNSVLALEVPRDFSVEYILGILNSDAAALLYAAAAPDAGQRTFPQVKVGRLKMLPIPDPRLGRNRRTAFEVEKIVRALEAGPGYGKRRDGLLKRLNRLVWKLYGLSQPCNLTAPARPKRYTPRP
jgi:hypothetical protein